ncbi:uncharacterized protein LOC117156252 [Bombus vancouverensis nearcticus]|nr:uncharacterized protein LOC100749168 [Bombus impatiens]XP_033189009.1 uncharacterized protein LOC117156252 [Bombus vancouverensis nearcticus]XP_050486506.1 uncharacterized protein LOC126871582 [Bombus huntii]
MLSINMRIFKTVLLLAALGSNRVAQCLPIANETSIVESSSPTTPPSYNSTVDYYDQRQNGSENYRIHVDGVVFVVAPVETLLLAGVAGDNKPNLPIIDSSKPQSSKPEVDSKPSPAPKSTHRAGLRLANLLVPLLRRFRQE